MRYSWADARRLVYEERPEPFYYRPYRRASLPFACLLANLRVPAWAVTLAGGAVGLAGLWMVTFGPNTVARLVVAALLLQLWVLSDFVDGGVARLRGTVSLSGAYLDEAVHHAIVAGLVAPLVALGLWLEGHGRIYVGVAFVYLLRSWFVRWHESRVDQLVARQAGLPPPTAPGVSGGGNRTTGLAGVVSSLLAHANNFIGVALGASLAFLLEAAGVVPAGWARTVWVVGITAALMVASAVGIIRGVTPHGLTAREARLRARFQEHQKIAHEKGLI